MIFLYLNKAYDALDRSRCLEILEGYCSLLLIKALYSVSIIFGKVLRLFDKLTFFRVGNGNFFVLLT